MLDNQFLANGLILMLNPTSILDHMLLGAVDSVSGLSSIRALLGGAVLATWASVLVGVYKADVTYTLVGIINLSAVIFARLVGYFVDGSFPEFVPMIVPPIVALALLLIAYKLMTSEADAQA